jgi:hypothetical protein
VGWEVTVILSERLSTSRICLPISERVVVVGFISLEVEAGFIIIVVGADTGVEAGEDFKVLDFERWCGLFDKSWLAFVYLYHPQDNDIIQS